MANPVLRNGVASPFSIYSTYSNTQAQGKHDLGELGFLGNRTFRWARLADTTAIGTCKLAQSSPNVANHIGQTGATTGLTAGSTRITAVLGATAAFINEYEGGCFVVGNATTGLGQHYRIKGGHAAVGSGGTITLDLLDPIVTTPTGTVTWSLHHSEYDIVIQPTSATNAAAGVTMVDWPAATNAAPIFGWVQTGGVANVFKDATTTVAGTGVIQGATAGAVGLEVAASVAQRVGIAVEGSATASIYKAVRLLLE